MDREIINKVQVNEAGELLLLIEGGGKPMYQYVYREAAGVYWDDKIQGFKSTPITEWSYSQWFSHIVSVVKSGLGVELSLDENAIWHDVSEKDKAEIMRSHAN